MIHLAQLNQTFILIENYTFSLLILKMKIASKFILLRNFIWIQETYSTCMYYINAT